MEVTGKLIVKGETQTFGNDFTKCEVVVMTEEQYPQPIAIEFVKDKIALLDKFNIGDNVKVSINLRGREWLDPKTNKNRYFNSIQGWRIEAGESSDVKAFEPQAQAPLGNDDNDEVPF